MCQLSLEGVVDRLDDLLEPFEKSLSRTGFLTFASGAQQCDTGVSELGLELPAVIILVRDEGLETSRMWEAEYSVRYSR